MFMYIFFHQLKKLEQNLIVAFANLLTPFHLSSEEESKLYVIN